MLTHAHVHLASQLPSALPVLGRELLWATVGSAECGSNIYDEAGACHNIGAGRQEPQIFSYCVQRFRVWWICLLFGSASLTANHLPPLLLDQTSLCPSTASDCPTVRHSDMTLLILSIPFRHIFNKLNIYIYTLIVVQYFLSQIRLKLIPLFYCRDVSHVSVFEKIITMGLRVDG